MIPVFLGAFDQTVEHIVGSFEPLRLELLYGIRIEVLVEEPTVGPPSTAIGNDGESPIHPDAVTKTLKAR